MMRRLALAACSGSLLIAFSVSCPATSVSGDTANADSSVQVEEQNPDLMIAREIIAALPEERRQQMEELGLLDEKVLADLVSQHGREEVEALLEIAIATAEASATGNPARNAEVVVGEPLEWRQIAARRPDDGPFLTKTKVYSGNYDLDQDDELLYIAFPELRDDESRWSRIELDGEHAQVAPIDFGQNVLWGTWDYNGDGRDELLVQGSLLDGEQVQSGEIEFAGATDSDGMFIYSLEGKLMGTLAGHPMGPQVVQCDLDGDGLEDLFMAGEGSYGDMNLPAVGFGLGGKIIFEESSDWNTPYICSGDIDGDGKDELLTGFAGQQVLFTGLSEGGKADSGSVTPQATLFAVTWCEDLDGDGRDELIGQSGEVLDADGKELSVLESPPDGPTPPSIDGVFFENIHLTDLGDERIIVITSTLASALLGDGGTVGLWDTAGKLIYLEYIGESINQSFLARDAEAEHVVLLTDTRILCWP